MVSEEHERHRIPGLDGIRGAAALFVVVHHCWLLTFPGYPANNGPGWLGPLVYGRFAVVVFIVLSGFSLAIGPARHGWRLGGLKRYARRRARRILPPYWAALALSVAVAVAIPALPLTAAPTARTVVVYGLLLQDFVTAPAPNGAFWSVAVEAVLYLVFPVLLFIRRRAGAIATMVAVVAPVAVVGVVWPRTSAMTGYALELAPLFTIGVVAAGAVRGAIPWHWLAAPAAAPAVVLVALKGPVWTVEHYFWVDLAAGPAIALFLAALATGRVRSIARLLDSSRAQEIGGFSYSLYLIHLPIVAVISRRVVAPYVQHGLPAFCATLIVAVPVCLTTARHFARLVERPHIVAATRRHAVLR